MCIRENCVEITDIVMLQNRSGHQNRTFVNCCWTMLDIFIADALYFNTLCSDKNTHSRFLLYLPGKCLDLHKIFRVFLRGIRFSTDIKIRYSLLPIT